MTKWKYAIDIHKEFGQAKGGDISPADFGKAVARKLKVLPEEAKDETLEDIILSLETAEDKEELDSHMNALWDWADEDHRLWIWLHNPPPGRKHDG